MTELIKLFETNLAESNKGPNEDMRRTNEMLIIRLDKIEKDSKDKDKETKATKKSLEDISSILNNLADLLAKQTENSNKHFEEASKRAEEASKQVTKQEEQTMQMSNTLAALGTRIQDIEANSKTPNVPARPAGNDTEPSSKSGKVEA